MEGYTNILCATDFSDNCRLAAERALEISRYHGAKLTLLHVVEYFPEDRSNADIAPEDADPVVYHEKKARAALADLAHQLGDGAVVQEIILSPHSAKHEISDFAQQQGVDLIVLASHGHHGILSMLGSTACGVAHSATCDVLTVRPRG